MPYQIINAGKAFQTSTFLDTAIMDAWNTYQGNWMEITAATLSSTNYPGALYGTVDSNGNFDFYTAQSTSSTLVGSIESPQTWAAANHGWSVTGEVLGQAGTFNGFMATTPTSTQYPTLGAAIGNRLSGAINRGVMEIPSTPPAPGTLLSVQPLCPNAFPIPAPAYENSFAAELTNVAATMGYKPYAVYSYPYSDLCLSTDTTAYGPPGQPITLTVTINNS